MITPSFGLTATERVLPRLALDFTTASLDGRITFTRSGNTATCTNSLGYIEAINANLPRFDYNSVTLVCKGLLIEESKTNLQINSNDFNSWAKTNVNVTIDATEVSPDGLNNANKIALTSTPGSVTADPSIVLSAGAHTSSVYAKKGNTDFIVVRLRQPGVTDIAFVRFNLATGSIASTTAGSGTITFVGNGWYRCTVTGTAAAAEHTTIIYPNNNTGQASGEFVFCFGAQLESEAFATSYIPTVASQVTRSADVATMTGANFSDWFNASQGTFRVDAITPASGTRSLISADDDTLGNSLVMSTVGTAPKLVVTQSSAEQANVSAGTITANTSMFAYSSYAANYFGIARPSARQVDTSGTVPTVDRLRIGAGQPGNYANGIIQAIQFWP